MKLSEKLFLIGIIVKVVEIGIVHFIFNDNDVLIKIGNTICVSFLVSSIITSFITPKNETYKT